MTLNPARQERVREELAVRPALAGLTEKEAIADLEWSPTRPHRTMQIEVGSDPVDV
ncbi:MULTISPECIES: hypothetical protein [unclassified Nocardiopsis]|uniref:hypothetical protein n=1 Tax=unclassified Nocardiopsis TaxID=2649073 RepID=UPI00135C65B4|nr:MULTISPECIES: hypothetical protein [unclassified Nocardiopsis]